MKDIVPNFNIYKSQSGLCSQYYGLILQTTRKKNNWKIEKNFGESSCDFGDGTDQRVQSLMFMMMMTRKKHAEKVNLQNSSKFLSLGIA